MAEFALFITAFLAATILPFSSEAAFVLALKEGMPAVNAMLSASSGNILAIMLNYALGYFLYEKTKKSLHKTQFGRTAYKNGHKYGSLALLLSWLPLIGDPLTLVAGLVRLNFFYFLVIAGSLRVVRYYFLTIIF